MGYLLIEEPLANIVLFFISVFVCIICLNTVASKQGYFKNSSIYLRPRALNPNAVTLRVVCEPRTTSQNTSVWRIY